MPIKETTRLQNEYKGLQNTLNEIDNDLQKMISAGYKATSGSLDDFTKRVESFKDKISTEKSLIRSIIKSFFKELDYDQKSSIKQSEYDYRGLGSEAREIGKDTRDISVDDESLSKSVEQTGRLAKVSDKAKQEFDELHAVLEDITKENIKINKTYLKHGAELTPKKLANAYKRLNQQLVDHKKAQDKVSKFDFSEHDATVTGGNTKDSEYAKTKSEDQLKGIESLISKYNQLAGIKKKIDITGGYIDSLPEGHGTIPPVFDPGTGVKDQVKKQIKEQSEEQKVIQNEIVSNIKKQKNAQDTF